MRLRLLLGIIVAGTVLTTRADADSASTHHHYESPQHFAFELKLGPYAANLDSEFAGGVHPFKDIFGAGRMLMFQSELDVQVWHGFGSLGLGFSAGFGSTSANTCYDTGDVNVPASCTASDKTDGDKTKLSLIPLAVLAVYRFDVLAERWNVPLVPYIKIGPNYTLWSMHKSNGHVSSYTDAQGRVYKGRGGVLGWELDAGLAFRLDFVEPGSARKLDAETGVNHTYLFAEFHHVSAERLPDIGDSTIFGGLMFEF